MTDTRAQIEPGARDRAGHGTLLGVAVILAAFSLRAVSSLSLLPGWDLDPMVIPYVPSGLGPAGSLASDFLAMTGATAVLVNAPRGAARRTLAQLGLVLLGAIPLIYHGWVKDSATLADQRQGAAWLSAMVCAVAIRSAARDARVRALVIATLIGLAAVMTCKGLVQVLVENPATIADFRANQEQYLAAQGFSPDSPMAKAYIRRVESNDPTVWMGLTNVFATFAAMGLSLACPLACWFALRARRMDRNAKLGVAAGAAAVLCAVGAFIAGSKGGFVAGLLAVGLAALGFTTLARGRVAAIVGPALVAAAIAAVVVRGLVGERIGELSLLFRWFYMKAAAQIGAANPLGVGPDGFKDAYLLVKDPLSPEEVASPHSVLLDWWACLGWLGVAWAALWVYWLVRASGHLNASLGWKAAVKADASTAQAIPTASDERTLIRAVAGVAVIATIGAMWTERFATSPEAAAVRVGGLLVWLTLGCTIGLAALRAPGWVGRVALAVAAIVACVHSQIEMSGTWVQSCGLVLAALGAASAHSGLPRAAALRASGVMRAAAVAVIALLSARVLWSATVARLGGSQLEEAATALRPIAELAGDLQSSGVRSQPETQRRLRELVAKWVLPGTVPAHTSPDLLMSCVRAHAAFATTSRVATVSLGWPLVMDAVFREASRLDLATAVYFSQAGVDPQAQIPLAAPTERPSIPGETVGGRPVPGPDPSVPRVSPLHRAVASAQIRTERGRPRAEAFNWLATVHLAATDLYAPRPAAAEHLALAEGALRRAAALDPTNPLHIHRLLRVQERLGLPPEQLAATARLLLRLDDNQRLDRSVRGLDAAERARVQALAAASAVAPAP
ncbi:MAG: O-antigen ligase family protein [Phycisphaerales bacterium]